MGVHMSFKITDTKSMNRNTLRGVFSLLVGPMKIEGFTFHQKGEKSWIGFPSKEYTDKESGEKKYWPIIRIEDKDRYWKFQDWCKKQLKGVFDAPQESEPPEPTEQITGDQGDGDAPF
jgi:hypothetical protein